LDGGRSYDVVSLEAKLRNNDKMISHQNLQVSKENPIFKKTTTLASKVSIFAKD
jgi:hypothetical protein